MILFLLSSSRLQPIRVLVLEKAYTAWEWVKEGVPYREPAHRTLLEGAVFF